MNTEDFYAIDRLVEFGLGIAVAQQMINAMNHTTANTQIPRAMIPTSNQIALPPFFIILDGKRTGPYTDNEIINLISNGKVTKETFAWKFGMPSWEKVENIPEALRLVALCPPPFEPNESNL